ncbi:SPFH domain-containing protein [Hydrogenoanaerobacterium saccharovorans]|uniref:SPFH domain-containing protein n=1 Tax=Hydrogenoanaerobacterium saccharovorans TaxID=474960 RepID=A0ABS2GLM0_9FIRM|nr:SPFH domain-containing protein [Hydrogenoanaerobacterium saccharovorans]MBM6922988.1 SPFH domain-containing protein [Hydrogenoanaerobacterium saccharovorans]
MGIIRAVTDAVSGALADQWLEVIEPDQMSDRTVFTAGVQMRQGERNSNTKRTSAVVSNGSVIHVYPNQFMLLVDGGKIVDYTAEEGYYTVNNSSEPSLFNGDLGDSVKESFNRVRFGGTTPYAQKVFYVNLQEIKGIKFGTTNPVNYFDSFYNSELFLRAFGTYSIKVVDPIKFYTEAIPKNAEHVDISDINEQYLSEFLGALQAAINQMSADGVRISHVTSKNMELSRYMADILDDDWKDLRGMEVVSVGLAGLSYSEESQKLINMRNQGAMLSDPNVREGYVQGSVARGLEAAGSNSAGSMAGFMGMGLGMNAGGSFVGAASQANQAQREAAARPAAPAEPADAPKQEAPAASAEDWTCECGSKNHGGKFCPNCGKGRPTARFCTNCGEKLSPNAKFCPNCGTKVE